MREIITLNVGKCGINFGNTIWEQYFSEHNIEPDGYSTDTDTGYLSVFFDEMTSKYIPRNIIIDSEPDIIETISHSKYASLFPSQYMISGQQSADNNFAKGYHTVGKQLIERISDKIRKLVDCCDNIQGFIMNHSVGGGTGSGLGSLILENISVNYRKKAKFGYEIYDDKISTHPMEPYNALFSNNCLLNHTDISYVFDNKQISNLCCNYLHIHRPNLMNINCLLSKTVSGSTLTFRKSDDLILYMNDMITYLVPFPSLHFMVSAFTPIVADANASKINVFENAPNRILLDAFMRRYCCMYNVNITDIINEYYVVFKIQYGVRDIQSVASMFFDPAFFSISCDEYDAEEDKFMAVYNMYRGDAKNKEMNATTPWLKTNKKVSFVEWCPTGFKLDLDFKRISCLENDTMIAPKLSGTMIGNNVCIGNFFDNRINKRFDKLYMEKAYIEKYCNEGMEESEFVECREAVDGLNQDYLDVLAEQATDSDWE